MGERRDSGTGQSLAGGGRAGRAGTGSGRSAAAKPKPRPRPGSLRLLLGGVALLAIAVLLAAAILNWGPFGGGAEESVKAETGIVVPGGDALLVNDLVAAEDGAVWAATESGLVRWTSEGRAIVIPGDEFGFPDAPNQALAVAEDGSL